MSARGIAAKKLRGITGGRPRIHPIVIPEIPRATPPDIPIDFVSELQAGVRAHARAILTALTRALTRKTIDGAQVDRLASALERLAELERKLDGRPLPGSRRPGRDDAKPPLPPPRAPVSPLLPETHAPSRSLIDEQGGEPEIVYAEEP